MLYHILHLINVFPRLLGGHSSFCVSRMLSRVSHWTKIKFQFLPWLLVSAHSSCLISCHFPPCSPHFSYTDLLSVSLNINVFFFLEKVDSSLWKLFHYASSRHAHILLRVQFQYHLVKGTHNCNYHSLLNLNEVHCCSP